MGKSLKFVLLTAVLFIGVIAKTQAEPAAENQLEVSVYYEALCPDSMRFIRYSLNKAMMDNGWLPYTDLKFIPYGKVTRWTDPSSNITTLFCQHGNTECELNALHACIVENNPVEEQMKLINCLMRGYNTNIDKCAKKYKIDVSAAKKCKATRSTPDILNKYGDATDSIEITFVPSIGMDGEFKREDQQKLISHFDEVYCAKYVEKYGVTLNGCK